MRGKLESSDNLLRDAMRMAVPVEEPGKVEERREKLVRRIERQIILAPGRASKSESRRRWAQGLKWGSAAAALCLAVGAGMWLQAQHQGGSSASSLAQVPSEQEQSALAGPARLAQSGEHLATQRGERQALKLPGDTLVSVGERTGLRLLEALPDRQVLELDYGRVDVEVTPKAEGPARYVSVKTPHALVEVKGTVFSVDVTDSSGAPDGVSTKVTVKRGLVLVRHAKGELTLQAGESWSSALRFADAKPARATTSGKTHSVKAQSVKAHAAQTDVDGAPEATGQDDEDSLVVGAGAQELAESSRGVSGQAADLPASPGSRVPGSTLAEENALFERAIAAAQGGQRDKALLLLDDFLGKYPRSPLRDAVRAKKTRLLSE